MPENNNAVDRQKLERIANDLVSVGHLVYAQFNTIADEGAPPDSEVSYIGYYLQKCIEGIAEDIGSLIE